jgi:hypothetical protein
METKPVVDRSAMKICDVRTTTIIVQVRKDGGSEVCAPAEKTNRVDATIAALKSQ